MARTASTFVLANWFNVFRILTFDIKFLPLPLPHLHLHPLALALCTNNRFDPVSETFAQTLVKSADPILAGNEGSVHAFDADGRVMYVYLTELNLSTTFWPRHTRSLGGFAQSLPCAYFFWLAIRELLFSLAYTPHRNPTKS